MIRINFLRSLTSKQNFPTHRMHKEGILVEFCSELHFIFIYPGTVFYSTAQKRYFKQYLTCLAQVTTTRRAIWHLFWQIGIPWFDLNDGFLRDSSETYVYFTCLGTFPQLSWQIEYDSWKYEKISVLAAALDQR